VRGLSDERVALGVDGPYAWEVVSTLLGPSVLGMPYLTILRRGEVQCVRAGKTGAYGYVLLVPRAEVAGVEARLADLGAAFDLAAVDLEALDVCALENGHFSMRVAPSSASSPLTPIELQLQWRVSYDKDFVGARALGERRAAGPGVRTAAFVAEGPVAPGQPVHRDGAKTGETLAACYSPTLDRWIGRALLPVQLAHPHVPLVVATSNGTTPIVTCTTPLVDNLSLHVDLHKHAYATQRAR
jgi:aminomethyltransferase